MRFVFLSHRSSDKPRLRGFVLELADRGVPVWVDNPEEFNLGLSAGEPRVEAADLAGGVEKLEDWPAQIDHALVQACAIVVFWSRAWDPEQPILVREHNAAHIYGTVRKSTYLPVFLDSERDLPEAVRCYRRDVNDLVQGYDVARYGDVHWAELTHRLVDLVRPATRSDDRVVEALPGVVDWAAEVSAREKDPDRIVSLLLRLPPGPAVDPFLLRRPLRSAVANGLSADGATALVTEAGGMVLRTCSADLRKHPDNLIIMPADTPSAHHVTRAAFWATVFDHACSLGPRMVGALLLCVPPRALGGLEPEAASVMSRLEESS